ncbi:hypothetical protein [Pedobacter sp. MC2016-24]|uniref:hypothetical protein n=1 Tax=Pedobacter sp. MC2016-24 TaxID=2780090 RepID=UPI001880F4B7|nr:hypothetical protein [Pedobacter sp. MC2016-24]MBE9599831.1 hypothetical protein [Pedobacter sp. MC2016-24]
MTETLNPLYVFSTISLNPQILAKHVLSDEDFRVWKSFLSNEHDKIRLKMVQQLLGTKSAAEKKIFASSAQQQLIFISDQLNISLFRKKKYWESHSHAAEIRNHYFHTLSFVEELLDFAQQAFPDYYDCNLKLTDFRLKDALPELRMFFNRLRIRLFSKGISSRLLGCVISGLDDLLGKGPSKNDELYIRHLCERLLSEDIHDDTSLNEMLIRLDFNQPEFFLYQVDHLDQRLFEIHGLHEQREFLFQQKTLNRRFAPDSNYRLYPKQSSLISDLDCYITEREVAVEGLMELRRRAVIDKINAEQAFRILMDMTVPQLALFFRIQMEVGLLVKDQITEVFNFVAQHFYTEKALFISSTNMLKLSTTIEFNTVLKVYDMLSKMTAWLEEHFGVSNYSR